MLLHYLVKSLSHYRLILARFLYHSVWTSECGGGPVYFCDLLNIVPCLYIGSLL